MKGDFTRFTWDRSRHYRAVTLQQGRVTLDADWNEQVAITEHRVETGMLDVVGGCGGPLDAAGFHLVAAVTDLDADEQSRPENQDAPALAGAADFYISGGRYYVRGRLVENEAIVPFTAQPHLPSAVPTQSGVYIAYLDVWDRHRTALEDPAIREVALGGPDTATRIQTLWQVRLVRAGGPGDPITCLSASTAYDEATASPTGQLRARAQPGATSSDPCIVPPGAGFRRLENQLYRLEVHRSGPRGTATFKWSRDNGSVVARWESQSGDDITVSSTGPDEVLSFAPGMWVELIDEEHELLGTPGTLVRVAAVSDRVLTLDPLTADGPTDLLSFGSLPRVRRWDSPGTLQPTNADWTALEDGVEVRFSTGSYRTGDYWLIPARTATADVEWPRDGVTPLPRSPFGVEHRYCRLAVLHFDGTGWTAIADCRALFPPLTELIELQYVGGDGQEALPAAQLDAPLQVGVANGEHPVAGARVRFTRVDSTGQLLAGSDVEESGSAAERIVLTGADGLAEVNWQLGGPGSDVTQEVLAELLDVAGDPLHLPVRFHARLSIASRVWYDGAGCGLLAGATTVQDAIAGLADQTRLVRYGGEGQNADGNGVLPLPLQVVVASACGPVAAAIVTFTPQGNGRVAASAGDLPGSTPGAALSLASDATGHAQVFWQLEASPASQCQQLTAQLTAGAGQVHAPDALLFTACRGGGRCHPFLDDLRSDGVVRRPATAALGLAILPAAGGGIAVDHTAGTAYVAGCDYDIAAGTLGLNAGQLLNQVVVDDQGVVGLLDTASPPPAFARLADVYVFGGQVRRIVDRRLDLTHLDDQVQALREHVAAKRRDRRRYIPLLSYTIPDLTYRDGRNYLVGATSPLGLAFDGELIWAASFTDAVAFVRRDAGGAPAETLPVPGRTYRAAYDGDTDIWFTSPQRLSGGEPTANNQVFAVDRRTHAVRVLGVGASPVGIAFDGARMWVANLGSRSISVCDVGRFAVVRTIALPLSPTGAPTTPLSLAFDGQFMWIGTNTPVLYRVGLDTALQPVTVEGLVQAQALAFDGAAMWVAQGTSGAVGQVDALSMESRFFDVQGNDLVCDGSRMWVVSPQEGGARLVAVDCATGVMFFRQQSVPGLVLGGAFDGSHVWLSVFQGQDTQQGSIRRILVG